MLLGKVSKAFDKVNYNRLFLKLSNRKTPVCFIKVLHNGPLEISPLNRQWRWCELGSSIKTANLSTEKLSYSSQNSMLFIFDD